MVTERTVFKLTLDTGLVPFDEWYNSLVDKRMRAAVIGRMARVRAGNFGDHRPVGEGVQELRIDLGPGLRIYYAEHGREILVLIGGGDKSTQQKDISKAISLWKQWKSKHGGKK